METTTTAPPKKNRGGRPLGSMSKLAREAREKAQATGVLPHEFLLSVARGELQAHRVVDPETGEVTTEYISPDFEKRIDAAKAAAPYYAPKISTVEVIAGVSDDDLDRIIASAAAEAGVSLGAAGEGEEDEGEGGEGAAARAPAPAGGGRQRVVAKRVD